MPLRAFLLEMGIQMGNSMPGEMEAVRPNRMDVDLGVLPHDLYGVPAVQWSVADLAPYRSILESRLIHTGLIKSGMRGAGVDAPARVGVIPFGLAGGYRPIVPGQPACDLHEGKRIPIRGVSLEHITLDLSEQPEARVGDEGVLVGESDGETITLGGLAEWQGSRIHHVLMAFNQSVPVRHRDG